MFFPFFFGGRVLAPLDIVSEMYQPWNGSKDMPRVHNHFVTDAVTNFIPHRLVLHESIRQDGYVGWNPFVFGGTAQHANTMLISHEITQGLHRWLDFWPAWVLGRFFQFLLAGIGMALFLASRGYSRGICAFGATAYMLNQQFVAWIYFNQVVAAFCWLPWVFWALFQAWEKNPRWVAWAGLGIGLALLGATLQQAAFLVVALGCFWLGCLREAKKNRGLITGCIFFAGTAGAGLAAFALQPSIAFFLENAAAGHSRGVLGYEHGGWQPLLNLLGSPLTAYPFLLGSVQSLDLWKLFKLDLFFIGFFGTLPMVVACLGLFSRKVPLAARLMVASGVLIPLTPLVGYLYHRFNIVWILGGCWAACAWLSKTPREERQIWVVKLGWVTAVLVGVWILASLALLAGRDRLEPWLQGQVLAAATTSHFGFFTEWFQARAARLIDYLCLWNPWQLVGLSGLLLSLWGVNRIEEPRPVAFCCALGVFMQLSVFWWQWTTWSRPDLPYGTTGLEKFLQKEVGSSGLLAMDTRSAEEQFLPANTLMPAGIAVTEGYDAMHPHGLRSSTGLKWDFPGTTHFLGQLSRPSPQAWDLIWQERTWGLWRNPTPAAGRFFSGSESPPQILSRDRLLRPTPNTIEVTLPAGARDVEIYSNWHRGWFWRMPGMRPWRPVGLGENRSLRIELPKVLAQETTVQLRYDAGPPRWVVVVSLGSAVLLLFGGFFGLRPFSIHRQDQPV